FYIKINFPSRPVYCEIDTSMQAEPALFRPLCGGARKMRQTAGDEQRTLDMATGTLTACSYEDPNTILNIDPTLQKLLLVALRRRPITLKLRNDSTECMSVARGFYRGTTWCLTDRGLACVLRLAAADEGKDSAIDVSQIDAIEVE